MSDPKSSAERAEHEIAALGTALEALLEALDRPEADTEQLRTAWESCAAREEAVLDQLRQCGDASPEEREELQGLLRSVAQLHGLAQQAALRERDEAADALGRARAVLDGLRQNRTPDVSGGSCDVAG